MQRTAWVTRIGTTMALIASMMLGLPPRAEARSDHPFGCRANELFMEAQAWWSNPDGGRGNDFGHLHSGLCFPHQATVTGTLTLRVRSVLHRNPGHFRSLQVQIWQGADAAIRVVKRDFTPARTLATCARTGGERLDNGHTCVWWDPIAVDTTRAAFDGQAQLRVRAFVREPDGKEMRTSTSLHVLLANGGKPWYDDLYQRLSEVEGRSWYTGVNYSRATINLPTLAVRSGMWSPAVALTEGAHGIPITGHLAAIDPDLHHGDVGLVLRQGRGEYRGPLRIDTTRLANGWHRLLLKADAFDATSGSTNSAVLVIWFAVHN